MAPIQINIATSEENQQSHLKANSFRYAAESINNLLQDSSAVYAIANCVQNSIDVDSLPGPVKQLLTFPLAPAILSPHLTVPNCPMVYPQ